MGEQAALMMSRGWTAPEQGGDLCPVTESVTVALPHSVTSDSAFEGCERASPRLRDVEGEPTNSRRTEQELAPIDGGYAAWRLLCAAFMFETLLWGKLLSLIEVDR